MVRRHRWLFRSVTGLAFLVATFVGFQLVASAVGADSPPLPAPPALATTAEDESSWSPFFERPTRVPSRPFPIREGTTAEEAEGSSSERFSVSGTVAGADGRPLAGVAVEVWDEPRSERLTFASNRTDDAGRFTVLSPARTFSLVVRTQRGSAGYEEGVVQSQRISLPEGDRSLDGVRFRLERPRVELAGAVRSPEGRPLSGLGVRLHGEDGTVAARTVTGRGGEYALGGLPLGRYRLALEHPAAPQGLWFGGGSAPSSAKAFELRSSARLDLVAPPLSTD
jgi:hypothetical protein